MAVFAQGGSGHDGDICEDGGVGYEVAEGRVVRAVEDEVVVLEDGECVGGGESEVMGYVGGVWVESGAWLAIEGKGGRESVCTGVGRAVLIRP